MKKMIFAGAASLSLFFNLHGMREMKYPPISQSIKNFYYEGKNIIFSQLTKDQRATIMLMISEEPKVAVENLKDSKNNNLFHLIFSSHDTLTNSLVTDAFSHCLRLRNDTMLEEKNASGQSPLDLVEGMLDKLLKRFYINCINGEEEEKVSAIPWPAKSPQDDQ